MERYAGTGSPDDFHMYARFRLTMVRMFGSLASALYELGADRDTGHISRETFVTACSARFRVLTRAEAFDLFTHITTEPLTSGGFVEPRHLGISAEDWQLVVKQKKLAEEDKALPFQSGPSGISLGIFPRTSLKRQGSTNRGGGHDDALDGPGISGTGRRGPSKAGRKKEKPKPWAPSMLAGEGLDHGQRFTRSLRGGGGDAKPLQFAGSPLAATAAGTLGAPTRSRAVCDTGSGQLTSHCPPSRREMEPQVCARQASRWWPYEGQRPPLKCEVPNDIARAVRDAARAGRAWT